MPQHMELWLFNMVLSIAMRILLSPALCSAYFDYADKLLKCYVTNFAKIYGPEQVEYNTHSLIHLADDARKFGALDNVSCFPFENYLGTLKRLVKRPQGLVPQLVRRLGERNRLDNGQERRNKPQIVLHVCSTSSTGTREVLFPSLKATTVLMLREELL